MKHIRKIICIILCMTLLTGCSAKDTWNPKKQSLFTFDYGCTIAEAESYFGLTKTNRVSVEEIRDETYYTYDISHLKTGANSLSLVTFSPKCGDTIYPLGVRWIRVGFDDKETALSVYQQQLDACDNAYSYHPSEYAHAYGNWDNYADSEYVALSTALAKTNPDFPNMHGSTFDAMLWNEVLPLVSSDVTFNVQEMTPPLPSGEYVLSFNGLTLIYAQNDTYCSAWHQELAENNYRSIQME